MGKSVMSDSEFQFCLKSEAGGEMDTPAKARVPLSHLPQCILITN